ncbi:hypothetical protein [Chenggangzhangella methanolivorans]|uniref:Uncharacterized protein n=1 Tax=Chenggangzhangella methanolivorans TaxID=1437009 RepID=A0A9E6UQI0_9HYPH|nr:hypothetical protein [Chenggangzhangella methanolivorans]QZO00965.1 hypothetical protein K6K41_04945 [Chenggangzhangella methanolivorans]
MRRHDLLVCRSPTPDFGASHRNCTGNNYVYDFQKRRSRRRRHSRLERDLRGRPVWPVDGKGQAGAAAHRTIQQDTVARGDYSAAEEQMVAPSESYRSAELRRGSERGYETRSVSEPRGYRSDAQMSEEPSAEVSGPQDRR